ncbi:MAG: MATE family efflux transporter [Caldithrix sp.]|nr:MATE family efflux transporter [Caldithrix sp.]
MPSERYLIINKNLHRTILNLSIPGMVTSVFQTLYQLIDAYWVGKIGPAALAAMSGCSFILWSLIALTALSVNGITALVAQNIGAGKPARGRFIAGQGMVLSTFLALLLMVVVFVFEQSIFEIMGFNARVTLLAFDYLNILLSGLIFIFIFASFEGVFRGIGDTRTPMYILAIALTLNAIADPVFIFGWFGFPALGVGGAALATITAQAFAAILAFYMLTRKGFLATIKWSSKIRIELTAIKRIADIGLPIALGGFFFSIIYVFLTGLIAQFGTAAIAAIGIGHRIEGIAWFACVGFSVSAATLVGQNLGYRRIEGARRAAWWVNAYGVVTLLGVSIIYFVFSHFLLQIFTDDPAVQVIGVRYLRIIAIFEMFLALEVIMEGVFSGAGYTLPVMLVTIPITALRIPLAWFLAFQLDWGINGIWWAISFTTFLKGGLNLLLFKLGLWKRKLSEVAND